MSLFVKAFVAVVGCCAAVAVAQEAPATRQAADAPAPTPSEHLGRPLGVDFDLADWNEVSSYYRKLGERLDTVETLKVGETTEGRDFLICVVSSPENLANLDAIKANARTLADPRGKSEEELQHAIADARPIVFVSCQMHSTETAGSQFSMELLHTLATSDEPLWKRAREDVVTVLFTTLTASTTSPSGTASTSARPTRRAGSRSSTSTTAATTTTATGSC